MTATRTATGVNAGDPTRPQLLEGLIAPPEWTTDALCAQTDAESFFPEKGGSVREAKSTCTGGPGRAPCPVREQCLAYALDNNEAFGIWGGYSERERRKLRGRVA